MSRNQRAPSQSQSRTGASNTEAFQALRRSALLKSPLPLQDILANFVAVSELAHELAVLVVAAAAVVVLIVEQQQQQCDPLSDPLQER